MYTHARVSHHTLHRALDATNRVLCSRAHKQTRHDRRVVSLNRDPTRTSHPSSHRARVERVRKEKFPTHLITRRRRRTFLPVRSTRRRVVGAHAGARAPARDAFKVMAIIACVYRCVDRKRVGVHARFRWSLFSFTPFVTSASRGSWRVASSRRLARAPTRNGK